VVAISQCTELGSVYTLEELKKISKFCRENQLFLFLDGARIGNALLDNKLYPTLRDISNLVDVFYIGGTKNGALFGEAIVIMNDMFKPNFRSIIKQRGLLLAKGFVVGSQFRQLFSNDLFFKNARHANKMAAKLGKIIKQKGYKFKLPILSNQIFPILPNDIIEELEKKFEFYRWNDEAKNLSCVRLVCSWATLDDEIDAFADALK
jgi:threonine aldolase